MNVLFGFFSLLSLTLCQDIIDFSHTDSIQRTITAQSQPFQVAIDLQQTKPDYLFFPSSCSLTDSLQNQASFESDEILNLHQQQLSGLKDKIRELLRLSELIKSSKKNIEQSASFVKSRSAVSNGVSDSQFAELQLLESNLRNTNQTINQMVRNLSQLIFQQINRTKQGNFDELRLTFQLKMIQGRLQYLEYLKSLDPSDAPSNFDGFALSLFQDLKDQISREKRQFGKVSDLLNKYSDRQQFKLKISNLESQRDGINMMIKEKESCDEKRMETFNSQNKKVLDHIVSELKRLKSVEASESSFCQGVTPSLQKQLKKILKVYNYSFACSEGLSDLKNSRLLIEIELQRLKKAESDIEYESKSEKLRKYFSDQNAWQDRLMSQIETIRLSQHFLNKTSIEGEILIARDRIKQISYQLEHPPQNPNIAIDYERIRAMISQIEKHQNDYCRLKEEYLAKYRVEDIHVRSLEHQTEVAAEQEQDHIARVSSLRELEFSFHQLREQILSEIK